MKFSIVRTDTPRASAAHRLETSNFGMFISLDWFSMRAGSHGQAIRQGSEDDSFSLAFSYLGKNGQLRGAG
jgi:hypothetical protein